MCDFCGSRGSSRLRGRKKEVLHGFLSSGVPTIFFSLVRRHTFYCNYDDHWTSFISGHTGYLFLTPHRKELITLLLFRTFVCTPTITWLHICLYFDVVVVRASLTVQLGWQVGFLVPHRHDTKCEKYNNVFLRINPNFHQTYFWIDKDEKGHNNNNNNDDDDNVAERRRRRTGKEMKESKHREWCEMKVYKDRKNLEIFFFTNCWKYTILFTHAKQK